MRKSLSKIIETGDIGKVRYSQEVDETDTEPNRLLQIFASVGCTQALIGFLSPTYNLIYKGTHDFYQGFVYCMSCTILLVMICLVLYCIWFWRQLDQRKKKLEATDYGTMEKT